MNCRGCGAPITGPECNYCGTLVNDTSEAPIEIEISAGIKRQGLEDIVVGILGDGEDLEAIVSRLSDQVESLWSTNDFKKADAVIVAYSKRLPKHDEINLLLAKTSFFFGLSTIKDTSTAHVGKRYLTDANRYLDRISDSKYQAAVDDLRARIVSTESKTIGAFTVWDDDDLATANAKLGMETATSVGAGIGTILGWIVAIIIGLGMLIPLLETF